MLFHSSIRNELARSFGATLVVLVTIVMTIMPIRTLGQASQASVNPSEVDLSDVLHPMLRMSSHQESRA